MAENDKIERLEAKVDTLASKLDILLAHFKINPPEDTFHSMETESVKSEETAINEEIASLDAWANGESESFAEPDIQQTTDYDDMSFINIPSNEYNSKVNYEQTEQPAEPQKDPRGPSRSESTESFEEICSNPDEEQNEELTSNTSASVIDTNEAQQNHSSGETSGETTPRAKSPGNLTDDERLRIEEAVANQRKSIENLKKLVSSQNLSDQDITRNVSPQCPVSMASDTADTIRQIAQQCQDNGMIKKSAFFGEADRAPMNSHESVTSSFTDCGTVNESDPGSTIWINSDDLNEPPTRSITRVSDPSIQSLQSFNSHQTPPPMDDSIYNYGTGIPTEPRPLPEQTPFRPTEPRSLPSSVDELQLDLERDQNALEQSTMNPCEPPPLTKSVDFTPVNGLRMLQREFGEGHDPLYSVLLRQYEYDSIAAARVIREKDLTSEYLMAKLELEKYNVKADPHCLAEMVVTIGNLNQLITAYLEHQYNEQNSVLNVQNRQPASQSSMTSSTTSVWNKLMNFVASHTA